MIGHHLRLTRAELERALAEPEWISELVEAVLDGEEDDPRHHSVGTAWSALAFLAGKRDFPSDFVLGEHSVPWEDDWGYGPPRYLTADQVWTVSRAVSAVDPGTLLGEVTPEDLTQAEVYPVSSWAGTGLESVAGEYAELSRFLREAARTNSAVLTWIA